MKSDKTVLLDQFQSVPSTLTSPSPQLWAKLVILLHPLSVLVLNWISQKFIFIALPNQLMEENL